MTLSPFKPTISWLIVLYSSCFFQIYAQKTFYFSSTSGDDSRTEAQAQNPLTPWKSLEKASLITLNPGDSILFKSGDTFEGTLTIDDKGTNNQRIIISTYGEGTPPVFSGSQAITNWSTHNGDIQVAEVEKEIHQFFIDDEIQTLAREPEEGYYKTDRAVPNNPLQAESEVLKGATDWTGASFHIRFQPWSLSRVDITQFDKNTGRFTVDELHQSYSEVPANKVFFINNHIAALDSPGEWFYDASTKKLYVYPPDGVNLSSMSSLGSVHNNGIVLKEAKFVEVEGITLKHYAESGIFSEFNSSDIRLVNNKVYHCYHHGIHVKSKNSVLRNNLIDGGVLFGIRSSSGNALLEDNEIRNIGLIHQLNKEGLGRGCCNARGLVIGGGDNTIRSNTLENIGYNGIAFGGTDNLIEKNTIKYFCLTTYDGSAIYTWSSSYNSIGASGTIIRKNMILGGTDSLGNRDFPKDDQGGTNWWSNGIYLDDRTKNITVEDNFVYNTYYGIYLHNTKRHIVKNNKVYRCTVAGLNAFEDQIGGKGEMVDNIWEGNDVFTDNENGKVVSLRSIFYAEPRSFNPGVLTNNRYFNPVSEAPMGYLKEKYDLASWKEVLNLDLTSEANDFFWTPTLVTPEPGATNLVKNGNFDENIDSWSCWASKGGCQNTWDGSSKSLKIKLSSSSDGNYSLTSSKGFSLTKEQPYQITFKARANEFTSIRVWVRLNQAPYTSYFQKEIRIDTKWRTYTFTLEPEQTVANARIDFQINSTEEWYVDEVALLPAVITEVDINSWSAYFFNDTESTQKFSLPEGSWSTLRGEIYEGSISLDSYASEIIYKLNPLAEDCLGIAGGTATVDSCGKCIGGTTGELSDDTDNDGIPDCQDVCPDDPMNTCDVMIEPGTLQLPFIPGDTSVLISSNFDWNVIFFPEWISLSQTDGSGDQSLTITFTENPWLAPREGFISLKGKSIKDTLWIIQAGNPLGSDCQASDSLWVDNNSPTTVRVNWTPASEVDTYRLKYRKQGISQWTYQLGLTNTTATIDKLDEASLYQWAVGTDCESNQTLWTLPAVFYTEGFSLAAVENLNATVQAPKVYLSWTDMSDLEAGFIIERKDNTGEYIPIDTLGENATLFLDSLELKLGDTYSYRVKTFHPDYNSGISQEVSVNTNLTTSITGEHLEEEVSVYPNPARDFITLKHIMGLGKIQWWSMHGKLVRENIYPFSGMDTLNIPQELRRGIYLMRILLDDGSIYTHKIALQAK